MKTAPRTLFRALRVGRERAGQFGATVKKGQVLAVIASPAASEQRSELQTAQKRLALAKTTFERESGSGEQKFPPSRTTCKPARR